jgi:hypothetical protein
MQFVIGGVFYLPNNCEGSGTRRRRIRVKTGKAIITIRVGWTGRGSNTIDQESEQSQIADADVGVTFEMQIQSASLSRLYRARYGPCEHDRSCLAPCPATGHVYVPRGGLKSGFCRVRFGRFVTAAFGPCRTNIQAGSDSTRSPIRTSNVGTNLRQKPW